MVCKLMKNMHEKSKNKAENVKNEYNFKHNRRHFV